MTSITTYFLAVFLQLFFVRSPSLLPSLQTKVAPLTSDHNTPMSSTYACLPYHTICSFAPPQSFYPSPSSLKTLCNLYLEETCVHGNANTNGPARQLTVNSFLCFFSLEASRNCHSPLLPINLHKTYIKPPLYSTVCTD